MKDFVNRYWGIIVAVVGLVSTLVAGYMTIAVEKRNVPLPGIVFIWPASPDEAVSLPYSAANNGTGFLATLLLGTTMAGVGVASYRRGLKDPDLPAQAEGLPGIIGKIALGLAINYLTARAPKTPNELDDNILKLLIALRDSSLLDLLAVHEALDKAKKERVESETPYRGS